MKKYGKKIEVREAGVSSDEHLFRAKFQFYSV